DAGAWRRDAHADIPWRVARDSELQRDGFGEGEPRSECALPRAVPRPGRYPGQRHLCRADKNARGSRDRRLFEDPALRRKERAAVTEEFHPGFRNSTASYTVSLLHPKVIADLRLAAHGLRIVERPIANFLPLSERDAIAVGGGLEATQAEVARFSRKDAETLPAYYAMLGRVADVLRALLLETPPNVGGGIQNILQAWKVGGRLKGLGISERRDLLDLFTKSAGEILDHWFESEPIKA